MYNRLLNYTFDFFSYIDKSKAVQLTNSLVSPAGVKDSLLGRLEENERTRYQLFKASFNEDNVQDPLLKLEQRVLGKYTNGLIDAGQMNTQLHKVKLLNRMRFAEHYNTYITDKENFQYFKLKYASNFGEFEKYAFKHHELDVSKDNHFFSPNFRRYRSKTSDYPMF